MAPPDTNNDSANELGDAYEPSQPPRQGFGRFLRDVLIIAVLGGAGIYFYKQHVDTREEVEALADDARRKTKAADLAALRESEELFLEALELDPGDGRVEAALAEVYLLKHSIHGLDTLGEASKYLSGAESKDVQTPSRYAVAAYLKIEKGQPEQAERMVKALLDEGKSAPALAHALGWALMEQNDHAEAARILASASDTDFSAVAYRLTMAENAHRQGQPKAAIKHLSGVVRPNINPNHDLARAYLAALRLKSYGNLTTPSKLIQEFEDSDHAHGPRAQAYAEWARAEFSLAIGAADKAREHLESATSTLADFPPLHGLKGRIHVAAGEMDEAIAAYEKAIALSPLYRGLKWELAELKSDRGDDAALTLVEELEKTKQGLVGPEFEIFRGEHALAKGDLEAAKAHFTAAADLGDDPKILLGLAKVAFEEEKKKGKKADLEQVAEPLQRAMDAQKYFPEAQEFYGDVNLWNFLVDGAQGAYEEAEKHLKRLKRPIPEVLAFYDRVIAKYDDIDNRRIRRQARKLEEAWKQRKQEYISSLVPG